MGNIGSRIIEDPRATSNATNSKKPKKKAATSCFRPLIHRWWRGLGQRLETRSYQGSNPKLDIGAATIQNKSMDHQLSGGSSNSELDLELLSPKSLQNLANKSQAEQIYIAWLANCSKNAQALASIFKTNNKIAISIALEATRFFKGDFNIDFVPIDHFVNNILSAASRQTVCKILSLYGAHLEHENLAEELFSKTLPVYKIDLVVRLLPACGIQFIWSQVEKNNVIVPCQQLILIYKNDSKGVIDYIENLLKNDLINKNEHNYNDLFCRLPQKHPAKFLKIYDLYEDKITIKLGEKPTLSLLKIGLNSIRQKPAAYLKILHLPTLRRQLEESGFESLVLDSMPTEESKFEINVFCSTISEAYEQSYRTEFLMKTYSSKYNGSSVLSRSDFSQWEMIKFLPVDVRNEWALGKMENKDSSAVVKKEFYLQFVSPDKSIPQLESLSKSTSDMEYRITLLELMIDCCQINDDRDCLLNVLSYAKSRHENDPEVLRYRFLCRLQSCFHLHSLTTQHWTIINEMLEPPNINTDLEGRIKLLNCILEQNLWFCLDNNQPIESLIDKCMKYDIGNINLLVGVPNHEFVILEAFFEKYRIFIEANISNLTAIIGMVNTLIVSYKNRSDNLKRSVTECTWLMDVLRKLIGQNDLNHMEVTLTLLRNDVKASIMFADSIFKSNPSENTYLYYLKHDVSVLERNVSYGPDPELSQRMEQCERKNKRLEEVYSTEKSDINLLNCGNIEVKNSFNLSMDINLNFGEKNKKNNEVDDDENKPKVNGCKYDGEEKGETNKTDDGKKGKHGGDIEKKGKSDENVGREGILNGDVGDEEGSTGDHFSSEGRPEPDDIFNGVRSRTHSIGEEDGEGEGESFNEGDVGEIRRSKIFNNIREYGEDKKYVITGGGGELKIFNAEGDYKKGNDAADGMRSRYTSIGDEDGEGEGGVMKQRSVLMINKLGDSVCRQRGDKLLKCEEDHESDWENLEDDEQVLESIIDKQREEKEGKEKEINVLQKEEDNSEDEYISDDSEEEHLNSNKDVENKSEDSDDEYLESNGEDDAEEDVKEEHLEYKEEVEYESEDSNDEYLEENREDDEAEDDEDDDD